MKEITRKQLIKEYKNTRSNWLKPIESSYKYVSKDITHFIDKTFKTGVWVQHKVYLKDLQILFEGSKVRIFTSYSVDISVDYEQSAIPRGEAIKIKGPLNGTVEANIQLLGTISIDEKAQLHIQASQDDTKVEFTKIALPSAVNLLDILKVTNTEKFLTKKLLEEPINKYIFHQVQEKISKKQLDIQLAQRIQKLVQEHSQPLSLSKDLWLVPQANTISISQLIGEGKTCSNTLSINVGIIAKPKLITSTSKPIVSVPKSIPIICETFNPKIYLYPSLDIKYDFVETLLEKELQTLINNEYKDTEYSINNVQIYPSDSKLVVAIDLVKKKNDTKLATFYLWGTPKLNHKAMNVSVENFDYTLESKSYLLETANWILENKVKNFIQKRILFSYKDEFDKLSKQLSEIEYTSGKKIITGNIDLIGVEDIFTAKDSLVVHALATGNLSYKMKFFNLKN